MKTFIHQSVVRMYDTDAAGIIYFSSQFRLAHDAFEALMDAEGFSLRDLFSTSPFLFVIVHAESDYMDSLRLGDIVTIHVSVSRVGSSSFTMHYELYSDDVHKGRVETVHVCIDRETRRKEPIPSLYREALTSYRHD